VLIAYAFLGTVAAEREVDSGNGMNLLDRWNIHQEEASKAEEMSTPMGKDGPRGFSYLDGPYPNAQDNGALGTDPPDVQHMPWGSHHVSDVNTYPPASMFEKIYRPTDAGGAYIVGEVHEIYTGDQNGNGNGLDNDGDGCVDEYIGKGPWDIPPYCDVIPDAMVIYETGGSPRLGGKNGDLLVNLDWYDHVEVLELYRALASPRWNAYQLRGTMYYPQVAGEFISYYSIEWMNRVNSNPEMDNDRNDWYLGSVDARFFPSRAPKNQACSAGIRHYKDATYERVDGWVVTSYSLVEFYDDFDWNGDGDKKDHVAAYYAINPSTGNCRIGVNGAVGGQLVRNSGEILMPRYTYEKSDGRDWDKDGYLYEYVRLYHNIDSTWSVKGKIYRSYTFKPLLIAHQKYGFGWWGVIDDEWTYDAHPLNTGGSFYKYVGSSQGYYHTYYFTTADEDNNRHTPLPTHFVAIGMPTATLGGKCIVITSYEYYLEYANIDLIGSRADGNGDGDTSDHLGLIFCITQSGGGGFVVEPTSKYAKGLYNDPLPFIWLGTVIAYSSNGISGPGYVLFQRTEPELHDDCDGDGVVGFTYGYCYTMYRFAIPPGGDGGKGKTPRGDDGGPPITTSEVPVDYHFKGIGAGWDGPSSKRTV
jgi:hypothetical protein